MRILGWTITRTPAAPAAPVETVLPITRACVECGTEYTIAPDDQRWYRVRDLELPRRCDTCRAARRRARKAAREYTARAARPDRGRDAR